MDLPPFQHRCRPWHGAAAAFLGLAALAAGQYGALVLAYASVQGGLVLEPGPAGTSYFADDLASVPARSLTTMLVALPCWGLVHYYGRRGPWMALFYALVVSVVGFIAIQRDAGPLDPPVQYLVYAVPTVAALLLTWRLSYRRVRLPDPPPAYPREATPPGPWQA